MGVNMKEFNIGVKLTNGSEIDITLDVSSFNIESINDEKEIDNILRDLIKEQYPEYKNKIVQIYC